VNPDVGAAAVPDIQRSRSEESDSHWAHDHDTGCLAPFAGQFENRIGVRVGLAQSIIEEECTMTVAPGVILPESEIAAICRRYQVKELALFGSAARGELRPDSDIDLLVEFLPGAEVDLVEHLAAERELSELLGRKVDLVSKRALRKALREDVLSQARYIYAA
jgi:predicted nucleotidyltransferase